ncbi:hypothetical protein DOTSEDRAFT_73937 [Dothistroma septosporum NZE10]|uniref:Uncharacterized protein n=1 Tax=Dothistroma septosporum (strain NZE10 / CBS 128990) TaxID=675120 RepID=N1PHX3_DOTSN|nr:hypothetical protein DOTSEDRAFT_73937 [Dothistroma septosporum NZE10]
MSLLGSYLLTHRTISTPQQPSRSETTFPPPERPLQPERSSSLPRPLQQDNSTSTDEVEAAVVRAERNVRFMPIGGSTRCLLRI